MVFKHLLANAHTSRQIDESKLCTTLYNKWQRNGTNKNKTDRYE